VTAAIAQGHTQSTRQRRPLRLLTGCLMPLGFAGALGCASTTPPVENAKSEVVVSESVTPASEETSATTDADTVKASAAADAAKASSAAAAAAAAAEAEAQAANFEVAPEHAETPTGPMTPAVPAEITAAPSTATRTESGLAHQLLRPGSGKTRPTAQDTVRVHYSGWTTNGKMFDSSVQRGQPISFPLGGVIRGWTEGLQLMKPGGKFKFIIPPELGYGEGGAGQMIGPNATLRFDVELIAVVKADAE